MSYPALPDRRMPYDNDGTVIGYSVAGDSVGAAIVWGYGVSAYLTGAQMITANDRNTTSLGLNASSNVSIRRAFWLFFPEQREVSAFLYKVASVTPGGANTYIDTATFQGSNDTTNGVDGTWETATLSSGVGMDYNSSIDRWRSQITSVSFTGPKRVIRFQASNSGGSGGIDPCGWHVYGHKATGQTPDDIIYLDGNNTFAEFTAPADFGDRPLGTTSTWTFRVKNASATHTANTINIQCNDSDFIISSDGSTWVTTINIASLAAGASSGTLYIRDTTPSPGAALGPRFARIVTTVASYT